MRGKLMPILPTLIDPFLRCCTNDPVWHDVSGHRNHTKLLKQVRWKMNQGEFDGSLDVIQLVLSHKDQLMVAAII